MQEGKKKIFRREKLGVRSVRMLFDAALTLKGKRVSKAVKLRKCESFPWKEYLYKTLA